MQQCYFSAGGKRSFPDSASIELHPPTCFRPAGRRREKRTRVKANGKKVDHQKPQCIPFKPVEKRVCTCILYACACVRVVRVLICAELGVRRRTTESYSEVTCAFYRRDAAWLDSANNCNNTVKPRGLLTPN